MAVERAVAEDTPELEWSSRLRVWIWRKKTNRPRSLGGSQGEVFQVDYSRGGARAVVGAGGGVCVVTLERTP